jgi:hypothetical protein
MSMLRALAVAVLMCLPWLAHAAIGRTEGAWNVTDNGEAVYTIPIFTPSGTAGLTPALAFSYSSNKGNGALGVGWGISGLSRIERCPSIVASNGSTRDVRGDMLDRFCLNGNQLKYFAGAAYGQAGSEYRGEVDDFSRIKAFGSAGAGPAYFIVEQTMQRRNMLSRVRAATRSPTMPMEMPSRRTALRLLGQRITCRW